MAKIFSVSPSGLDTSGSVITQASSLALSSKSSNDDDDSGRTSPLTPLSPTDSDNPFSTLTPSTLTPGKGLQELLNTDEQSQKRKRHPSDLSKMVLSLFLSPAGYSLLRLDRSSSQKKKSSRAKGVEISKEVKIRPEEEENQEKASRLPSERKGSARTHGSFLIDPEEYRQWFRSEFDSPSGSRIPLFSSHPGDISSATRAGLRGFILAFVAGTILDVLLPALVKQKFSGMARKIIMDNSSSMYLGASAGGFAFLYRILFRHLSITLDRILPAPQEKRSMTSQRTDSGVDLECSGQHEGFSGEDKRGLMNGLKWIPASLAALLASPAFALVPDQSRRLTMALYFLTYAGEVTYSALEAKGRLDWVPKWCGVWLLFPISSGQIIHTFLHHGDCSPLTFRKAIKSQSTPFLTRPPGYNSKILGPYPQSNSITAGMNSFARAHALNPRTAGNDLIPLAVAKLADFTSQVFSTTPTAGTFLVPSAVQSILTMTEGMGHGSPMCRLYHPQMSSCTKAAVKLAGKNMRFSLKLYGTLAFLTFLVKGGDVFKNGIWTYFKRTILATVRSAIGTWGMMVTAFPMHCAMDRYFPADFIPTKRTYLNGFIGGLWIMVESQQRRSALTLYYIRVMLESVWRRLAKAGWVKNFRQGETLLFGLTMAVIMGIFETMPTLKRKSFIQTALEKIFVE